MDEKPNSNVAAVAAKHGFSEGAARAMLDAMRVSRGAMAQFSHPELGGMGQWSRGGMVMIGDMFNRDLKVRVGALADDLARSLGNERDSVKTGGGIEPIEPMQMERWWPAELGSPTSAGAQNGIRYAVFPDKRRVAVERDGRLSVHDTDDNIISGISQQQGSATSLRFLGNRGSVDLADLPPI